MGDEQGHMNKHCGVRVVAHVGGGAASKGGWYRNLSSTRHLSQKLINVSSHRRGGTCDQRM